MTRIVTVAFVLLLLAVATPARAQEPNLAGSTLPTFEELQREATALERQRPETATMAPVHVDDVEQVGAALDRLDEQLATGFDEIHTQLQGAPSFDDARVLLDDLRELSTRNADLARRYHQLILDQNDRQLQSDREGVALAERDGSRVETELGRVRQEEIVTGRMLESLEVEIERLSQEDDTDMSRLRTSATRYELTRDRLEALRVRRERLEKDGRQLARDRLHSAHDSLAYTQRRVYYAEQALSDISISAMMRSLFLDHLLDRERVRWARRRDDDRMGDGTPRGGFWPEPLRVPDGAGGVRSLQEDRDAKDRDRFNACVASGDSVSECAIRVVRGSR